MIDFSMPVLVGIRKPASIPKRPRIFETGGMREL
jgi:hypothetical protein